MKVYISGKISGLAKEEYEKHFNDAEKLLIAKGHDPVNPLRIIEVLGIDESDYPKLMGADIEALLRCDAIYMLHTWQDSLGAKAEKAVADIMGIKHLQL